MFVDCSKVSCTVLSWKANWHTRTMWSLRQSTEPTDGQHVRGLTKLELYAVRFVFCYLP